MILHEHHHAREFVRCPDCGDFCELIGTESQRVQDEDTFRAKHARCEKGTKR